MKKKKASKSETALSGCGNKDA